jgi:hypothetical protein
LQSLKANSDAESDTYRATDSDVGLVEKRRMAMVQPSLRDRLSHLGEQDAVPMAPQSPTGVDSRASFFGSPESGADARNQGSESPDRSQNRRFVHGALKHAFFTDPVALLVQVTTLRERPLVGLWRSVEEPEVSRNAEVDENTGLALTLVALGRDRACALVTLPQPTEAGEAYLIAMVSAAASYHYFILEAMLAPADDPGFGYLCEWTDERTHANPLIRVPATVPEFISAIQVQIGAAEGI